MTTHVLTGSHHSARGILIALREAFDAHAARMIEPDAAASESAHARTDRTGFAFALLGDVRHTV